MRVFWVDQLEFLIVCEECYEEHKDHQWTGSSNFLNPEQWEKQKEGAYRLAQQKKKCEMCGKECDS